MIQKNSVTVCAFAVLMALGFQAGAQEQRSISLSEAIDLGIQNNKALKRSYVALDKASAQLEEARDRRLPDVKLNGQYMRLNTPALSGPLLQSMAGQEDGESSGGSVKVNQVALGMATASLPLYAGGRINNGIQAAKYLEKAAALDADRQKEAVVENTIEAYYNLYKSQTYLELVKEHLKTARQRVTDFTHLEQNGLIPRNDLLSIQLQEKNMELSVLDAENNQQIANYNFDLLLGIDEKTEVALTVEPDKVSLPVANGMEYYEGLALRSRADVQALDHRATAAAYNTKVTKGAYLPTLALSGTYATIDVHNMLTVQNAVNGGIALSYNLADLYKNKSRVKQRVAQQEDLRLAQEELKDGIKLQTHKAYQDYLESLKKIEVLARAIDLANENYKIVKNKYDNSLATATELLDADASKLQANINFEFAKIDSKVAFHKLLLTTGTLYQSYYPQQK